MQSQQGARTFVFWLGPVALSAGVVLHAIWRVLPLERAGELGVLALAATIVSLLVAKMGRLSFASACAGLCVFAIAWFSGWVPLSATLLLALAAVGLGTLLVPKTMPARFTLSLVLGMAMIAAVVGWLLMFPIHGRFAYVIALLAVIVTRHRAIHDAISPAVVDWKHAVADAPGHAAIAIVVLILATTSCWLPTVQYDDLAAHLGLPWQLQTLGYYRLDAASYVGALSAWSGDVLHGIVQVVGGEEGRGALNALWLLIISSLLWHLGAALGLAAGLRWMAIALYASHPLTSALLGTMQAETPIAAGMLALALVIQRSPLPDGASFRLVAALAGFLLALKVSVVLTLVPMGLWLLWRWHAHLPWKQLPVALVLAIAIGGSSYAYALYIAGNPVLPFFNAIFKSQYFDIRNFKDAHWTTGFGPGIVWQMVFDTSHYLESRNGTAGFVLIAFSGAWLLGAVNPHARALALVGMASFLLPLAQIQYLRYAHPAIALLIPVMLLGAQTVASRRVLSCLCVVLCILNIAFYANAKWMLSNGILKQRVISGEDAVLNAYAPERLVNDYLRLHYQGPGYLALYAKPGSVFAAELAGRGLVTNWYDKQLGHLRSSCEADLTGKKWRELFALTGATHVVLRSSDMSPALRAALDPTHARKELHIGPVELWQLTMPARASAFMERRNIAKRLLAP